MTTQTGTDLITDALVEIGAYAAGDPVSAADLATGLRYLNRLIDSSNAEKATIFTAQLDTLTMTPNKQSYTIGVDPAGAAAPDFVAARPVKITNANLLLSTTVRRKIDVISETEWARIKYQNVSGPPRKLYNDRGFITGFATLRFYPIPDQAYQWEQYSWHQNANLALAANAIDYPPGYAEWWVYHLALRLAAPFGRTPTEATIEFAREARERVAALNCESPKLNAGDSAAFIGGEDAGLYNWLSGQIED
jgi:hypothetical protein